MPTLQPHEARQMAESFGTDAARYDRARPAYPEDLITRIVTESPGRAVLAVGCGTGIEARQLQAAGCTVLGVEPDERMAAFARSSGVPVEVATFETWAADGRLFDAAVAGQSWHWIDPLAGAAKAASVLRPGGLFAAFWHVFNPPAAVGDAFAEAYHRVVPDAPFDLRAARQASPYGALLTKAGKAFGGTGAFTEPELWQYEWARTYTRDEWLDQLPTQGTLTRLPAEKLTEILTAVGAAIDKMGGTIETNFTTITLATKRTA